VTTIPASGCANRPSKLGLKAWVRSSTDQMHNIAVQGPNSRDIMKEIIWTPPARPGVEELGWFRFTVGRIGAFAGPPVVVSRTGYTGELGYEIFCHPKDAAAVFDAVWEAGQPHGLKPLGLEALDMVRIEAGLVFAHYEFSDETDPFEAGIGFTVPLKTKEDDFIGKAALIERKAHPRRKLVGLEMDGNDPVGHGDCVHVGRAQVGVVTSGTRSPILKKTLRSPASMSLMPRSAPSSRWASSTATRSGCRRVSCASPITIRTRHGCAG
jgi:aminomethyltransferase